MSLRTRLMAERASDQARLDRWNEMVDPTWGCVTNTARLTGRIDVFDRVIKDLPAPVWCDCSDPIWRHSREVKDDGSCPECEGYVPGSLLEGHPKHKPDNRKNPS
jgi:hypothetical protein